MKKEDESELYRLCNILETIDKQCGPSAETHEAIAKAALALHHVFIYGHRSKIEEQFNNIGKPLTSEQITHLRQMGIEKEE